MVPLKITEVWLSKLEKVGQESCGLEVLNQIRKRLSLLVVFSFYQVVVSFVFLSNDSELVSHLPFRLLHKKFPERHSSLACQGA